MRIEGQAINGIIEVTLDYNFLYNVPSKKMIKDAIIKSDPFIDYSSFDLDNDGFLDTDELAIQVVTAAYS